jgi:hypothetical protein
MKKAGIILFAFIVIHLFINSQNSDAQWTQSNGPYVGGIKTLLASGTTLFSGVNEAGTYEASGINWFWTSYWNYTGLYSSSDNGLNWIASSSGLGTVNVYTLASISTNLFAGTDSGVFRSTNNGANWTGTSSGITNKRINTLFTHGSNLYAGTPTGIFLSTINGSFWSPVNNGLTYQYIYGFTSIGTNVYAGTNGGVFMSTNNGTNWTSIGISNLYIFAITSIGNNLFAGTLGAGIYKSTNNGGNWTSINNGLLNLNIYSFGVNGTDLYAGTEGGLFFTSNNGTSWSTSGITDYRVNAISVSGGNLFSGTESGGVFKSTNNGTNWNISSKGLYSSFIRMFAKYGSNLFCTGNRGVFLSTDNGLHWARRNTGFDANGVNDIDVTGLYNKNGVLFVSIWGSYNNGGPCGGGVFKSTNNGLQWTFCHNDSLYRYRGHGINGIGNTLFCSVINRNVFFSTNDGYSWREAYPPYNALNIISNGTHLFTADDILDVNHPEWAMGICRFNESSFSNINGGLPTKIWHSLAVEGNTLFAGTDTGRIYKTTNLGSNWILSNNGIPNTADIISLTLSGQNIFAGTLSHGLYVSKDGGNTWTLKNDGLEFPVGISAIYLSGSDVLIGTTNQSVWRRALSELLGVQNISSEVPSGYSLGQNYPNPFNPTTVVRFKLSVVSNVLLNVYDVKGREVQTLVNERLQPGTYETTFDGSMLTSGVYFYKISVHHGGSSTGDFTETKRMLLVK